MVEYGGRYMTYAEFERARLDRLMPPQPKKQWGKRSTGSDNAARDKQAEYRRRLLDARHQ